MRVSTREPDRTPRRPAADTDSSPGARHVSCPGRTLGLFRTVEVPAEPKPRHKRLRPRRTARRHGLQAAAALALKDAAAHTSIAFLEPCVEVTVTVPDVLVPLRHRPARRQPRHPHVHPEVPPTRAPDNC